MGGGGHRNRWEGEGVSVHGGGLNLRGTQSLQKCSLDGATEASRDRGTVRHVHGPLPGMHHPPASLRTPKPAVNVAIHKGRALCELGKEGRGVCSLWFGHIT